MVCYWQQKTWAVCVQRTVLLQTQDAHTSSLEGFISCRSSCLGSDCGGSTTCSFQVSSDRSSPLTLGVQPIPPQRRVGEGRV